MVPSPPQRSGAFDEFNGNTWFDGKPSEFLIQYIEPAIAPDSSIRVVVNGTTSKTDKIFEDQVNLNVDGVVGTVVIIQRQSEGSLLRFEFDTDFVLESFDIYVDGVKMINTTP